MKQKYKEELEKVLPLLQSEDKESNLLGVSLFKESSFYHDLIALESPLTELGVFIFDKPNEETRFKDFINWCSNDKAYGAREIGSWIYDLLKGTSHLMIKQTVKSILIDFSINGN